MEPSEAARNVEPRVTVQVVTDFEHETGLALLDKGDRHKALMSLDHSLTLLYMACRHQYPRLSRSEFRDMLSPEDFGRGCHKMGESLRDFFGRYQAGYPATPTTETATD